MFKLCWLFNNIKLLICVTLSLSNVKKTYQKVWLAIGTLVQVKLGLTILKPVKTPTFKH